MQWQWIRYGFTSYGTVLIGFYIKENRISKKTITTIRKSTN